MTPPPHQQGDSQSPHHARSGHSSESTKPKRTSVACRRCRRLRIKCIQDLNKLPCAQCRSTGPPEAGLCAIPRRGDDRDRKYRIKAPSRQQEPSRRQIEISNGTWDSLSPSVDRPNFRGPLSPIRTHTIKSHSASEVWNLLPPHDELIRGARVFVTTCLQVGFIPKSLFLERLSKDRNSINVFLLPSLLAISARFTPELCVRFGSGKKAAEFFMEAANILIANEMFKTDLETAQAFFLLGMAEWGKGERNRSAIHMGISVRIAGVLRLHREETYALPQDASPDDIVESEHARRTFWAIKSHDNLYTQQHLPVSFANSDITTLLPCSENDFAFGRIPTERAALAGTVPSLKDPQLASLPNRSMFGTLIQVHDLWGMIARTASREQVSGDDMAIHPWEPISRYSSVAKILNEWEANVPSEHKWSTWNLRGYQAEHVDLAYLSIVTITRMNNIVLRRSYLENIVAHLLSPTSSDDGAPPGFWAAMAYELFSNVLQLYEAIETYFGLRSAEDGFPTMLAFCAYTCGSLVLYLCKWPQLCPQLCSSAQKVFNGTMDALLTFADKWPLAAEWTKLLSDVAQRGQDQRVRPVSEVSSREVLLNSLASNGPSPSRCSSQASPSQSTFRNENRARPDISTQHEGPTDGRTSPVARQDNADSLSDATAYGHTYEQLAADGHAPLPQLAQQTASLDASALANLDVPFESELSDYMQGYIHLDFADWHV